MSSEFFEPLVQIPAIDGMIAWRMQFQSLSFNLYNGDESCSLTVGPQAIEIGEILDAPDYTFRASREVWEEFISEKPKPKMQSILALAEFGHLSIEGDLLGLMRHGQMIEKLFASLRVRQPRSNVSKPHGTIEEIIGRYVHVDVNGRSHRIYYEEAGQGQVLLCLHTAGADARQYRGVLKNKELTKDHRVISFDLPWHGKSSPPAGFQDEVYLLTTDHYVETIMAFMDALKLENILLMGCSIGGRAVLHMALRHPEKLKAVIGLQSSDHAHAEMLASPELETAFPMSRPDVQSGEAGAAAVQSMMSPYSPDNEKWETLWHYMQGGPGVFMGDVNYYFIDGDMRNGMAARIDTAKCPVYLLSGEYDTSATPEMGRELADLIKAQYFEVMKGVGHFPMSEAPDQFMGYLLKVTEMIKKQDA